MNITCSPGVLALNIKNMNNKPMVLKSCHSILIKYVLPLQIEFTFSVILYSF